jgi:hypothetical protein
VQEAITAGALRSLLDFVSRFAMARQVGMVMISLLIVAVGLLALPQLRHVPTVTGGTVVNPDSSGEAAPSVGVRPAQRLDLKVDVRAGRIRSKEEEAQSTKLPVAAELAKGDAVAVGTPEGKPVAERPAADPAHALDDIDSVFEPEQAKDKAAHKGNEIALEKKRAGAHLSEPQAKGQLQASPPAGAGLGALAGAVRAEPKEPSAFPVNEAAAAPPAVPSPAPTRPASSPAPAATAEAASSMADSLRVARDPELELGRNAPAGAAKVEARPNACSSRLSGLERVVAADPTSARAGSALIEMALCRRQLGDEVGARALLERAARIAAVAERAKALLAAKVLVKPAPR